MTADRADAPRRGGLEITLFRIVALLIVVCLALAVVIVVTVRRIEAAGPRTSIERELRLAEDELKVKPQDADALFRLGRAQLAAGRTSRAIGTLEKAAAKSDKDAFPWVFLGDAYMERGDAASAAEAYQKGIEAADSKQAELLREYKSKGIRMTSVRDEGRDSALYGLANAKYTLGDLDAAKSTVKSLLEGAADAQGWYLLGQIEEKQGRGDEALAAYEKAVELVPDDEVFAAAVKRMKSK